jgi:hypothetical protein
LVGNDNEKINIAFNLLDTNAWKDCQEIPMWDGSTAPRIIDHILKLYEV